jgi:hypothetical protein
MIDPEDQGETFLQRWSRLKQAAEAPTHDDSVASLRKTSDADPDALPQTTAQSGVDLTAFDPTTLPPIESISASSDIRAFLAPGVPEGVKRAALRRAWVIDPAIRDFIGVAENQWDFNKPDSIPGFGSLELTPELCRMVAGLFSDPPAESTPPRLADTQTRERVHVYEILAESPSLAIASASRECDPKAGRSPAQVEGGRADSVETALPERPEDKALQPIHSKQETPTSK